MRKSVREYPRAGFLFMKLNLFILNVNRIIGSLDGGI